MKRRSVKRAPSRTRTAAHGRRTAPLSDQEPSAAVDAAPVTEIERSAAAALVNWFSSAKRMLPWRETYDPYAVWISEMMLQQTQVDTVLPYYQRWMDQFPTVADVARAPQETVLKAWEGLGYYSRARNLHQAAQIIVRDHSGQLPDSLDALQSLPGIGPYSAGAIASIAFNRAAPLVDGNVSRVLGRWLALDWDPSLPEGRAQVWATAGRLLAAAVAGGGAPRDFNQALMELGALICRPRAPQCLLCPWQGECRARQLGDPEAYPPRPVRKARPVRQGVMLLASRTAPSQERAWLVRRRPPRGIWGGLWEFPWLEHRSEEESAANLCAAILRELGQDTNSAAPVALGHISHGLTHFQLELDCVLQSSAGQTLAVESSEGAIRWATLTEIAALPLARLSHKALALLKRHEARSTRDVHPPTLA
jgi:A/G-specific adenine glycosylase